MFSIELSNKYCLQMTRLSTKTRKTKFSLFNTILSQCVDYFMALFSVLTATEILMLSMTSKEIKKLIDSNHSLLALLLSQDYPMLNNMILVREYEWEINLIINCWKTYPSNMLLPGAISGKVGEEVIFRVNVVNSTPHLLSAIPGEKYWMFRWKVKSVNRRDCRTLLTAHYNSTTVILECIDKDYALTKPTFLRIDNLVLHSVGVSPRALLATRIHQKCMTCNFRDASWTSYACCISTCRKLCKFCMSDRMITERALKQQWKVSVADIIILRKFAYRYHSSNNNTTLLQTMIPRACVIRHFNCNSWLQFLTQTFIRASTNQCNKKLVKH